MAAALVAELTKLVAEVKTVLAATKALQAVKTVSEKPAKKVKSDDAKVSRDSTPSFMARNAYGKVLRARYAGRYAADKAASISHLKTQKDLIDEDKATYDTFCGAFIAELETTGIPASRWKKDDEEYAAFEDAFISNMGSSNAAAPPKKAVAAAPPVKILTKKAKPAPAPKTPRRTRAFFRSPWAARTTSATPPQTICGRLTRTACRAPSSASTSLVTRMSRSTSATRRPSRDSPSE